MYPEVEERPLRRPDTALSVGIFSDAGLDDDIALEEAEEWTRDHPLSAGLANQGFEVRILSVYTYKYGNILKKSVSFFYHTNHLICQWPYMFPIFPVYFWARPIFPYIFSNLSYIPYFSWGVITLVRQKSGPLAPQSCDLFSNGCKGLISEF